MVMKKQKKVKKPVKSLKKSIKRVKLLAKKVKKPIVIKASSKKHTHYLEGEFIQTGIEGFDALFDKGYGLPSGYAVLIEGGPGSGKTTFCLSAMNSLCKKGKKCLYMSFEEPEERLIDHMNHFNWPAKEYIDKGLLRIKRFDALDVSRSVEALLSEAKKELLIEVDPILFPEDFKPDFVVLDSLTSIASAFSGQESRFRIYMEQLFRYLEKNKITNFLIREVSSPSHVGSTAREEGEAVSFLSDGIVVIYNVIYNNGERGGAIEILKMRGVSIKKKMVDFKIVDGKGVLIDPNKIIKREGKKPFVLT